MEQISLKEFNELLKSFTTFMHINKKIISTDSNDIAADEGVYHDIYELKSRPGLYLKVTMQYDSYGRTHVDGFQFVQPIEKVITDFIEI